MSKHGLPLMFEKQMGLNERLGRDHRNLNDEQLTKWFQDMLSAMTNECEEARSHTHWKWWKDYGTEINRNQLKIEVIDMMHFLISLALPLMDAQEFEDLYLGKMDLNHRRQDDGYDENYQKIDENGMEDNDHLFGNAGEKNERT
jgi:dimeric dUTPase (all-alpha-NTP-PPase superfamily)